MIETRPNLRGLAESQRILALASWYVWLSMEHLHLVNEVKGEAMRDLGRDIQPEAALRLSQAQRAYWREMLDAEATYD